VNAAKAPPSISQAERVGGRLDMSGGWFIAGKLPGCLAPAQPPILRQRNVKETAMPGFYRPPLDGREEDPFARDGDDKLIRRGYWLGLSDRSLVQLMTRGIGTRLTPDEKRAHLEDIRRAHLIEQVLAPEILPPERRS
jgi:hypothetical protein